MRTCISIRGDQLEQVTDFARAAGTNRSALMAEATLAYIAARKGQAKRNRHNHRATIEKCAAALDVTPEHLMED